MGKIFQNNFQKRKFKGQLCFDEHVKLIGIPSIIGKLLIYSNNN